MFVIFYESYEKKIYKRTSLLNALIKISAGDRPVLTDGIEIKEWNVKLEDNTDLVYSMWDFGRKKKTKIYMHIY